MTKIGIVGLGLIGGSLGLDLRASGLEIFGVSRNPKTCEIAMELEAVNHADVSLEILSQTEIIFICTPIDKIIPTVERLTLELNLNPETIITDVGSVKAPIVERCSQLWPNFVGGHPMAGTAEQGIYAAQKNLFVNRPYVLTSVETTPEKSVEKLREIVQKLGALLYDQCSPIEHDQAVAWISHLPVMVSASLIDACIHESDSNIQELAQKLASSGFRDTSRVGGGNPELGLMMAHYNREALLVSLSQYRQSLEQVIDLIENENWERLEEFLEKTQQLRGRFCS
ncbi:prephenate/arogenate dehydrogenase [Gloeothece verrucosa]|uniref:Prephenate dehydrogenase n=1 Tax=Gloeothece verrucosa (strain PCC 7822) TaxID=497965 RepID=E0UDJ0_GLOV7|nr:prephenate/arogenate dehydrogenase [Gloeothece verrucosa]ADN15303.1 Prephenate dehydrogenase [Gloeothece verrucosa PCC 7822]